MSNLLRIITLTLLLPAMWPSLWAQQGGVKRLSLQEAIDYAMTQSTEIKNAQINIADAEQQIVERRSTGLPQLTGSASFQRYLQIPRQPLPEGFSIFGLFTEALAVDLRPQLSEDTGNAIDEIYQGSQNGGDGSQGIAFFLKNNFTAALNLDAMVFDGSYFVALQAARQYRVYTEREFQVRKREVENAVLDAYLPLLLFDENRELLDKNIANLEELLHETRELYKAGFAEQLDVDRLDLSRANLLIERDNLDRQKEVALTALKYAIGYPLGDELDISDDLESLSSGVKEDMLVGEIDLQRRPEVNMLDQAITMNELNIKLNKAGYLPSLRAFGAVQQQYQGNDFKTGFWAPGAFVGLSLNVPIFDGLYKKSQIQRAELSQEMTRNQRKDLSRAIQLEVSTARTNYLNAQEKLENQQKNLDLAQRIYDTTQVKYREGVGSSVEVTQAEQSLYTTQANYLQALYEVVMAKMRLEQALGR